MKKLEIYVFRSYFNVSRFLKNSKKSYRLSTSTVQEMYFKKISKKELFINGPVEYFNALFVPCKICRKVEK